jgi:hypothetical protein
MSSGRIQVDQGVIIYRRHRAWWVDIHHSGGRQRRPLHTRERAKAIAVARELAASVVGGQWNISLSAETTFERIVEGFQSEYEPLHHCPSTRDYTTLVFERFGEFLRERHGKNVLVSYQAHRRSPRLRARSRRA